MLRVLVVSLLLVAPGCHALAGPPEITQPPDARAAPVCAEAVIGLDLRALPANSSIGAIDLFVQGEGARLQSAAPAGVKPRVLFWSGVGQLGANFDGATASEALSQCKKTIAAYLDAAPTLPTVPPKPAAKVITPCRPCP